MDSPVAQENRTISEEMEIDFSEVEDLKVLYTTLFSRNFYRR